MSARGVWDLLVDGRSRKAVEMIERHADGLAAPEKLDAAYGLAPRTAVTLDRQGGLVEVGEARINRPESAR